MKTKLIYAFAWFLAATPYLMIIASCGKNEKIVKRTEYKIEGEWRECSQTSRGACGVNLRCGDAIFQCVTNLEMRNQ
jgi:hypothetical protein